MATTLLQEIDAYKALLPEIRNRYGSVWALVVNRELVSTFREFSDAARYVIAHHNQEQVLIRHTDEQLETAPFVQINS